MATQILLILYNIVLTIILTVAVCCTLFLYHQSKRPMLVALGVLFAAYLLDNTIVFCTEVIPDFAIIYDQTFLKTPSVKTVYFVTIVGSLLFALHCAIPAFTLKQLAIMIFIYSALLICIPMISQNDWMLFFYYFTTQLLIIGISGWGLVALRNTEGSFDRGMLRRIFLYFLCLSILVLAEDSFVIFLFDKLSGPRVKIHNRNFSENLMYLGLAWPVFHYTLNRMKHVPVVTEETAQEEPDQPDREKMDFYTFCTAYNLTEREQEILFHLLEAKSQQQISDELYIALGTVKTHIHNIYQKTDCTNRNHITAKYAEFCKLRQNETI